jgi:hypothetical protein
MDLARIDPLLQSRLKEAVWGTCTPFPHVSTVLTVDAVPYDAAVQVSLRVRVKPFKHALHLGANLDEGVYISTPPQICEVGSSVTVSLESLKHADSMDAAHRLMDAAHRLMAEALRGVVRVAAPRLYEADPRIGSCDRTYPSLPLFDPPQGVDAMRGGMGWRCPLCGESGRDLGFAGYRAWGGGNIGWVHPTCLANVYT